MKPIQVDKDAHDRDRELCKQLDGFAGDRGQPDDKQLYGQRVDGERLRSEYGVTTALGFSHINSIDGYGRFPSNFSISGEIATGGSISGEIATGGESDTSAVKDAAEKLMRHLTALQRGDPLNRCRCFSEADWGDHVAPAIETLRAALAGGSR